MGLTSEILNLTLHEIFQKIPIATYFISLFMTLSIYKAAIEIMHFYEFYVL